MCVQYRKSNFLCTLCQNQAVVGGAAESWNAEELTLEQEDDDDSDDGTTENYSDVLLDASLPERFRTAFSGFVDGSTAAEEQRLRSQQSEAECDNTVTEYSDEDNEDTGRLRQHQ